MSKHTLSHVALNWFISQPEILLEDYKDTNITWKNIQRNIMLWTTIAVEMEVL